MDKPEGEICGWVSDSQACYCEHGCTNKREDCKEIKKFWPTDLAARDEYMERKGEEKSAQEIEMLNAALSAIEDQDAPKLVRMMFENGKVEMDFQGFISSTFGEIVAHYFNDYGAVNYLECTVMGRDTGPLVLTIQRTMGKTPHQLRIEAESKLNEADRRGFERGKEEAATNGVDAIRRDFTDRRGLRQQWDLIDPDTQLEIIEAWRGCLRALPYPGDKGE